MINIIDVDLDSREEYVNEYDDNKINNSLHDYIMDGLKNIKIDVLLKINFHYLVEDDEKEKVRDLLLNDFDDCLKKVNDELRRLNWQYIFLGILGVIFLAIYWYLEKFHVFIVSEFCLVVSWVVFWQIAESILFFRRNLIIERKKCKKLLSCKIEVN